MTNVICGLTAEKLGSAPWPMLVIQCGITLHFLDKNSNECGQLSILWTASDLCFKEAFKQQEFLVVPLTLARTGVVCRHVITYTPATSPANVTDSIYCTEDKYNCVTINNTCQSALQQLVLAGWLLKTSHSKWDMRCWAQMDTCRVKTTCRCVYLHAVNDFSLHS